MKVFNDPESTKMLTDSITNPSLIQLLEVTYNNIQNTVYHYRVLSQSLDFNET